MRKNAKKNSTKFYNKIIQRLKKRTYTARTISLEHYKLGDQKAIKLIQQLERNPRVTSLELSSNNLTDTTAEFLAKNTTLKTLLIADNKFSDKAALCLSKNFTLTDLTLSYNKITQAGFQSLMENNHTLTRLNLERSEVSGLVGIERNQSLLSLSLAYTPDNGRKPLMLEKLADNNTLQELNLTGAEIRDQESPAGILGNHSIVKIELINCFLEKEIEEKITKKINSNHSHWLREVEKLLILIKQLPAPLIQLLLTYLEMETPLYLELGDSLQDDKSSGSPLSIQNNPQHFFSKPNNTIMTNIFNDYEPALTCKY